MRFDFSFSLVSSPAPGSYMTLQARVGLLRSPLSRQLSLISFCIVCCCHQNNAHSVQVISETEQSDRFGRGEIFLSEPVLDSVLVIDTLIF